MRCFHCGGPPAGDTTPTLDPRFVMGHCPQCRKRRTFLDSDHGQARATDPPTSHAAAARVKTGTAKALLLTAHLNHPLGMTDEEAASWAGLAMTSEYATRCSELVRQGLLADTGEERAGASGMARMVRLITALGRDIAEKL
jgi:hypothetical protein